MTAKKPEEFREHPAVKAAAAAQRPRYSTAQDEAIPKNEAIPMVQHLLNIDQLSEAFDKHVYELRLARKRIEELEAALESLREAQ